MIFKKINSDKLKYDVLYRCACNFIKTKTDDDGIISAYKLNYLFGVYFHIPKNMRAYFISELIEIDFFEAIPDGKTYKYKVLM